MPWDAASDVCYERGLELASLPFPALAKELHARIMAIPHTVEFYWIGAHDLDADGKFEWADGTPWGAYSNWLPWDNAPGVADRLCVGVYTRWATMDQWWGKFTCGSPPGAFVCGSRSESAYPLGGAHLMWLILQRLGIKPCCTQLPVFGIKTRTQSSSADSHNHVRCRCPIPTIAPFTTTS